MEKYVLDNEVSLSFIRLFSIYFTITGVIKIIPFTEDFVIIYIV